MSRPVIKLRDEMTTEGVDCVARDIQALLSPLARASSKALGEVLARSQDHVIAKFAKVRY